LTDSNGKPTRRNFFDKRRAYLGKAAEGRDEGDHKPSGHEEARGPERSNPRSGREKIRRSSIQEVVGFISEKLVIPKVR